MNTPLTRTIDVTSSICDPGRGGGRSREPRPRWPGWVAATLAVLSLALLACGQGGNGEDAGVASLPTAPDTTVGSDDTASSGSSSDSGPGEADMVAYSQCMRDHDIANYPDPDSNGRLALDTESLGIEPSSPQFQAAVDACEPLLPQGGAQGLGAADREQFLAYSQCMRDSGIADFPDPSPDGPLQLDGIDTATPQFQAVDATCSEHLPGGGEGREVTPGGAGQ